MTFILPSFGASAISAVPGGGGGGGSFNTYSVEFDGTDDYMDTGSNFISTLNSDFTVSFWLKWVDLSGGYVMARPFGAWSADATDRLSIQVEDPANSLGSGSTFYLFYRIGGTGLVLSVSSLTFNSSDWYHFGVTVAQSGSNVVGTAYIDGTQIGTGSAALTMSSYNLNLNPYFGAFNRPDSSSPTTPRDQGHANVYLDEVAIIGSALSSSQITNIYKGEEDGGSGGTNGVPGSLSTFNPVGWWRMGDNDSGTGTTITDQGSGSSDATLVNSPAFSTDVPFNYHSIDLDGTDDYFSTGFAPSSIGTGDYSISWWFNVESGATVDHPYFFTFGATSGAGTATYQGCGLTGRSGDGYKLRVNNNFSGSYTQTASSSTSDVTAGNWYHLLFVRDGNTITLYKNGSSLITLSNANVGLNDLSLGSDLRVGLLHNSNSLFFTGLIDEFAIFNSALSSSDATAIYNSGVPADLASYSPVGWWRMGDNDGATGTTITDQGSDGNNGTLNNGPTFSTDTP